MAGGRCPAGKKRPKGATDSDVCLNNSKSKAKKSTWAHDGYKKSAAGTTRCGAGFRKSKKDPNVCIRTGVLNRNQKGQFTATKFSTGVNVASVKHGAPKKPGAKGNTHTKFT